MVIPQATAPAEQMLVLREEIMGSGVRPTLEEQRQGGDSMGNYGTEWAGVRTTEVAAGSARALLQEPQAGAGGWVHLHCHGGGLAMGSAKARVRWLGHLAMRSGWAVSNLDFRRAPANPYPAALEGTRASGWLVGEGCPADQIVVGGDSAGAALAETDVLTAGGALDMVRSFSIGEKDAADPHISPGPGKLAGVEVDLKLWDGVPNVHQLFPGNRPESDESIDVIADWLPSRTEAKP